MCAAQCEAGPDCPVRIIPGLHKVVWSVPYLSSCNPIEFAWAIIKQYARSQTCATTTAATARVALLDGMYGAPDGAAVGVGPAVACALVGSLHKTVAQWIRDLPRLRTLWPADTPAGDLTIASLDATRQAAYGALVAAHRTSRTRTRFVAAVAAASAGEAADDVAADAIGSSDSSSSDDDAPAPAPAAAAPAAAEPTAPVALLPVRLHYAAGFGP